MTSDFSDWWALAPLLTVIMLLLAYWFLVFLDCLDLCVLILAVFVIID